MIRVNNGSTTQAISRAAAADPSASSVLFAGWVRANAAGTGYLFHLDRSAATGFGLPVRLTTNTNLQILRSCGGSGSWFQWDATLPTSAAATPIFVAIWASPAATIGAASCRVWTAAVGDTTVTERSIAYSTSGTPAPDGSNLDPLGGELCVGQRRAAGPTDRSADVAVGDFTLWTASSATAAPSTAVLNAMLTGSLPADAGMPGAWTLRHHLPGIGGVLYDAAVQANWTVTGASANEELAHAPTAASPGTYPITAALAARYEAVAAGVLAAPYSASFRGTCIALYDRSGNSRHAYQGTATDVPRFKSDAPLGPRLAFGEHSSNRICTLTTSTGAKPDIANAGISVALVAAKPVGPNNNTSDFTSIGGADDANGLRIGSSRNGFVTVTVGGQLVTSTIRWQARRMALIVTVAGTAGNTAKAVSIYSAQGTWTGNTGAFTAASGPIRRLGPPAGTSDQRFFLELADLAIHASELSSSDAATILEHLNSKHNLPAAHRGVLVLVGSSTPVGLNTQRGGLGTILRHMTGYRDALVIGMGFAGTSYAEAEVTMASQPGGSVAFGTSAGQSGGISGQVVALYNDKVYLRNVTGTNNGTPLTITGNGTYSVTGVKTVLPGFGALSTSSTGAVPRFTDLLAVLSAAPAGPKAVVLMGDSNALAAGFDPTGQYLVADAMAQQIITASPGTRVFVSTIIPRSGGTEADYLAFNALAGGGGGGWAGLRLDTLAAFDWLPSGLSDRSNAAFYADDAGSIDGIHTNEAAMALIAGAFDAGVGSVFSARPSALAAILAARRRRRSPRPFGF
jgi:hypothetical protein